MSSIYKDIIKNNKVTPNICSPLNGLLHALIKNYLNYI